MFRVVSLFALLAVFCVSAQARDTKHLFSIEEAMNSAVFKERLNQGVKFYFGNQAHPGVTDQLGEYVSNKKTNAFNKSDLEACQWVLLSALLSFQDRALAEGGNAVVNIRSYYKAKEYSSETDYECHAGTFVAGVALKGKVVKVPE